MRLATAWKLARAETRRSWGRLSACVLAVALGVFALTLVRAISSSVDSSLSGQARQTMGADLTLSARQPLDQTTAPQLTEELTARGARWANQTRFYSMLTRQDSRSDRTNDEAVAGSEPARNNDQAPDTQLVRVRAIGTGFPFYGSIQTLPPDRFDTLSDAPAVIIDRQIAERLDLRAGEHVRLGELTLTVAAQFVSQPGSPAAGFSLAPSLYVHERFLPDMQLLKTGSRVNYERHFALPQGVDAEEWKRQHDGGGLDQPRIETAEGDSSNVQRFVQRLSGFLTVVALVTLLLGAVGIGSSMRVFMQQKLDHAAIFRVIGVTPRGLFAVYGLLALWISSLGCALGATLGVLLPVALGPGIRALGSGFLPDGVDVNLQPSAALVGVTAGLASTLVFTLAPLLQTALVSPLRILRRSVETQDAKRVVRRALVAAGLCAVAAVGLFWATSDGGSRRIGTSLTFAVALSSVILWGIATLMMRASQGLSRRVRSYAVRQGIANLHRPGNQTKSVIAAVGLAVFLLSAMFILQHSLQQALAFDQRRELPNLFVIDIQSDQLKDVLQVIEGAGASGLDESPMVAARIAALNQRELAGEADADEARDEAGGEDPNGERGEGRGRRSGDESDRRERMRTREYFISYRAAPIESETVTAGQFWSGTPERQEASIDAELARTLGVQLGDTITLNIQGLPLDAVVTSFREIRWQAVRPNSLILLSPGEIEEAPRQHVVSFRVADQRRYALQSELVRQFPNLTVLDVTQASQTVKLIIDRVATALRGLGSLSLVAGLLILGGAIASGRHARERESMLLKVVGANRATLRTILITEQLALSSLGVLAGWGLSEVVSRSLWPVFFDVPINVPYGVLLPFLAVVVTLSGALGALVSRRVTKRPALELLREE